ncbi:RNA-directed DNA polymerase, eukaryota [Tanacetum coccineum]
MGTQEAFEPKKADHTSKEDGEMSVCSGHFQKVTSVRSQGSFLQFMEDLVKLLWDYLHSMIEQWDGEVIIMGDFNEVRTQDERFGYIFNSHGDIIFNAFISSSGLIEVPMGGCSFTWVHKSATKMSKLDRFLISEGLLQSCPNISALTLDRYLSDHRPILFREICFDYGPTPFHFYHYWFEIEGFEKFVENVWNEHYPDDPNPMSCFMKKMQNLKKLRLWITSKKDSLRNQTSKLKSSLVEIDKLLDMGNVNSDLLNNRTNGINSLQDLENLKSLEVAQKVKIKWSIEGDENSKYFHGILNKKRNNLAIRGIFVDGIWIDSPPMVKNEFMSHFKHRFDRPSSDRLSLDMTFPNHLSSDSKDDLEKNVTKDELKRAVWDCGLDKSPGLDGFTFGFYRRYWSFLEKDVMEAVSYFFHHVVLGDIVSDVQSAFVADRQILDGPFILNDLTIVHRSTPIILMSLIKSPSKCLTGWKQCEAVSFMGSMQMKS